MMQYTAILGNGSLPVEEVALALLQGAERLVCADGGANAAAERGLKPDVVIGDFDSIRPDVYARLKREGVPLLSRAEQEHTDLEKALLYCRRQGVTTVAALGVTGGLLDHTLGNFSILSRYAEHVRCTVFDEHYRIDIITRPTSFRSAAGDRVSVIPLTPCPSVTYSGLRYMLTSEALAVGLREGTCNTALGERFGIDFQEGILAVFRPLNTAGLSMPSHDNAQPI